MVCSSTWLWGYLALKPFIGLPRLCLPTLKLQVSGEISHIFFEIVSLLRATDFNRTGEPKATELDNFLKGLTRSKLAELIQAGAKVCQVTCGAGHMIYIPCGWVPMEFTLDGTLHYGLRKQILTRSASRYTFLHTYIAQSLPDKKKKQGGKMISILDAMSKC